MCGFLLASFNVDDNDDDDDDNSDDGVRFMLVVSVFAASGHADKVLEESLKQLKDVSDWFISLC